MTGDRPQRAAERPARVRKDPAVRSEEIVGAACRLFSTEGSTGFNLRRVAEAVGVRLSTLQHHFPTRERLLTATLERLLGELNAPFEAKLAEPGLMPKERLRGLCELGLDQFAKPGTGDLIFEMFGLGHQEPFVRDILERRYEAYQDIFVRALRAFEPGGDDVRVRAAASLVTSQLQGLMLFVRRNGVGDAQGLIAQQLDRLIAQTVEMAADA